MVYVGDNNKGVGTSAYNVVDRMDIAGAGREREKKKEAVWAGGKAV